jgi:hypothetical protein
VTGYALELMDRSDLRISLRLHVSSKDDQKVSFHCELLVLLLLASAYCNICQTSMFLKALLSVQ